MLLGPDNGLLAPAVAMVGGARSVVSLDNPEYHLPAPGPTFAGRDILAPAAGHLAAGVPLAELGSPVDPAGLVPGLVSLPEVRDDGAIVGEVWWVDRFGNCQLNIDPDELRAGRRASRARGSRSSWPAGSAPRGWVHTYADAKPSELVLLVDSYGLLALALDRESAAAALGLRAGSGVTLVPEGGAVELTLGRGDEAGHDDRHRGPALPHPRRRDGAVRLQARVLTTSSLTSADRGADRARIPERQHDARCERRAARTTSAPLDAARPEGAQQLRAASESAARRVPRLATSERMKNGLPAANAGGLGAGWEASWTSANRSPRRLHSHTGSHRASPGGRSCTQDRRSPEKA